MVASDKIVSETISTYLQAAKANQETARRAGNVVEIGEADADTVMITADLHGNRLNFDRLLEIADLDTHDHRHLVMQEVCHGGPVYPFSSGCMSHLLLEDVAQLKAKYVDRFHFLLSNHEWAELADFPITKSSRMLNLSFRSGMREMYGPRAESVREASLKFIESCPLAVRIDQRVFVCHSTPERVDQCGFDVGALERPLSAQDLAAHGPVFQLVWGRDFRAENAAAFAKSVHAEILIHGHEPCPDGFAVPNRQQIILDCCGTRASYLILPTGSSLDFDAIVATVCTLGSAPNANSRPHI